MDITVNGHETFCYTAGKAFDPAKPTVVFVHGVLNDHSVWILQSRYLANHGWNVLALDLPGHCKSAGEPPASVEAAADFIVALLDAVRVDRAALVGHSWGSLIALEAAARLRERVSHLVLVGTAAPMKVSAVLLEAALNDPQKGITMINVFSRSTLAPPPSSFGPGTWIFGASVALNRRVLASNTHVNLFHRGFMASNSYCNAEKAVASLTCPVLFVLGVRDQMTNAKAAEPLVAAARASGRHVQVAHLPVGHHQMTEAPEQTLFAIRDFLAT